jgi:hypothetical protein
MCKGKMVKTALWLNSENRGSLTAVGIAYYSKLGLRRTKVLLKSIKG